MRKTCWVLLTLFMIGSLPGCGTLDYSSRYPVYKEMESWVNRPVSELIASWGEPSQILPSREGSVYVWAKDVPYGYSVFNEKKFWVNETGIIFQWDISGPGTFAPGAQK